jgi:hypothetical protein
MRCAWICAVSTPGPRIRFSTTSPVKKRSAGLSDSRQLLKTKARRPIGAALSEPARLYGVPDVLRSLTRLRDR